MLEYHPSLMNNGVQHRQCHTLVLDRNRSSAKNQHSVAVGPPYLHHTFSRRQQHYCTLHAILWNIFISTISMLTCTLDKDVLQGYFGMQYLIDILRWHCMSIGYLLFCLIFTFLSYTLQGDLIITDQYVDLSER